MGVGRIEVAGLTVKGEGSCIGGKHPDPPLDNFPLLCWMPSHPQFGSMVFLEDGKASVEQVALSIVQLLSYNAVALYFGTTPEHVTQAVTYANLAGYLGPK
jgi:hypothetical protein